MEQVLDRVDYEFEDFDDFARLFMVGLSMLRDGEDFYVAVVALVEELAAQNVRYAEITTTAHSHVTRGIPLEEYVAGLDEGRKAASRLGVEVNWIIDIPRSLEEPSSEFTIDLLTSGRAPDGVVGLGLGGPERGFPPHLYRASFERAKAEGLLAVPHAGETSGPAAVREAVDELRADRIGHGVRVVDDPRLLEEVAAARLPLEVCLSSNVLLNVCPDLQEHPVTTLAAAGAMVTINSDDPAYFSTTLTDEYLLAAGLLKLDRRGVAELAKDAFAVSALDEARVQSHLRELEHYVDDHDDPTGM